jgi:hypothetical protein
MRERVPVTRGASEQWHASEYVLVRIMNVRIFLALDCYAMCRIHTAGRGIYD